MSESAPDLSFEHATYAKEAQVRPPCSNCNGPIGDEYWKLGHSVVCTRCRGVIEATLATSQSKAAFWKAVLWGGGTALGCGIAYAIFVAVTDYQLALLTIGIAFVIAKVIRRASAGVGGRRFQILAVCFTYLASAMGYAPAVFAGLESSSAEKVEVAGAEAGDVKLAKSAPSNESTPTPAPSAKEPDTASAADMAMAMAFFVLITFAAPIISAVEAPLGLLIVAFGLWEAWKQTRGVLLALDGPFRVARAPAVEPTA